jgi:hypothetical protein
MLHPAGPGESRRLPEPDHIVFKAAFWVDNTHILAFGQKLGERSRGYLQDINNGPPRAFTPEGAVVDGPRWWTAPLSPDGTRVVAVDEHQSPLIYRLSDGSSEPINYLRPDDLPVQWAADGRALLVAHGGGAPWVVEHLDLATGTRTPAATIRAHDPAGLRISIFAISRDAKYYVHSFSRLLSDLYVVEGLK